MENSGRTLVCSVLFLDIVEYTKKPVSDQLQIKQEFNRVLTKALEQVPPRDRIILDTGDGAAVTFMGDPEDALFASMAVRDSAGALAVRLGVNLGPVRLVKDLNGQMNIIGDGINVAQRVMSFARPGQLLVSRSFYEVVSCLSRDYASLFHHEGARTDKHVREHDVYSVVGGTPTTRRLSDTLTQSLDGEISARWISRTGPLGLRHSALVAAGVVLAVLVAGGVGARAMLEPAPAAPESAATQAPGPVAATPAPSTPQTKAEAPAKKLTARLERRPEKQAVPAGAGRFELAIAPWGEVLVDGKSRGLSPPLRVSARASLAAPLVAVFAVGLSACSSAPLRELIQPGKGAAALATGVRQYDDGEYPEAARNIQAAIDLGLSDRDSARAHKNLAFIHCASARERACREEFSKALSIDPGLELTPAEAGHPVWGPIFASLKASPTPFKLALQQYEAGDYMESAKNFQGAIN